MKYSLALLFAFIAVAQAGVFQDLFNKLRGKKAPPKPLTPNQQFLSDIRDLLQGISDQSDEDYSVYSKNTAKISNLNVDAKLTLNDILPNVQAIRAQFNEHNVANAIKETADFVNNKPAAVTWDNSDLVKLLPLLEDRARKFCEPQVDEAITGLEEAAKKDTGAVRMAFDLVTRRFDAYFDRDIRTKALGLKQDIEEQLKKIK